ncbi:MAG TPA: hypothetical protein VGM41_19890 [Chitinophagaceae bacterium]|jgi:hypothetical protein
MKKFLFTCLVPVILPGLFGLTACRKTGAAEKASSPAQQSSTTAPGIFYTNSNAAMYVVAFINIDTKKTFTTLLSPNSKSAWLNLPAALTPGYYTIVLTPEGAYAHITTSYTIGETSGSLGSYPATIRKVYLPMGNGSPGAVPIALH